MTLLFSVISEFLNRREHRGREEREMNNEDTIIPNFHLTLFSLYTLRPLRPLWLIKTNPSVTAKHLR